MRFIEAYLTGFYTITELAARYGISRRIAHKWLTRHDANGAAGLQDRSRAPINIPHRTTDDIAAKVVAFRRRFRHMGPRKIAVRLAELHPDIEWPAPSTIGDILQRADLVSARRRRNPPTHPLRARAVATAPNDLMTVDYKGEFLLGNHQYCYPLTVVDHVSRFLLACIAPSKPRPRGHRSRPSSDSNSVLTGFGSTSTTNARTRPSDRNGRPASMCLRRDLTRRSCRRSSMPAIC